MSRILSADVLRLFVIIVVVTGHTFPFGYAENQPGSTAYWADIWINQSARFAVPFFFVMSGYFWGRKIRAGAPFLDYTSAVNRRILFLFFAWSVIYLIPFDLRYIRDMGILGPVKMLYWHIVYVIENPLQVLLIGTKDHLWFLNGLVWCLLFCAILIYLGAMRWLLPITLLLYAAGVLGQAYSNTPIGFELPFTARNGIFFGSAFFAAGYFLSGLANQSRWMWYGLGIFAFGYILHFAEISMLYRLFDAPLKQDYVFGTFFTGLGMSLVGLSNHHLIQSTKLSRVGQVTLGIYAIHFIFIDLFQIIDESLQTGWWEITFMVLTAVLSIATALLLSRFALTKRFVMAA